MYHFIPWISHNRITRAWPVAEAFFAELRKAEGATLPIGAAGFCWGGKLAVLLAEDAKADDGRPLVDAVFTGHPSWLKIPDEIEKITRPVSFAVGDKDPQVSVAQAEQIRGIVEALPEAIRGEVRVYEKAGHGFCLRADVAFKDAEIVSQATEAEDQCIAWFSKHFHAAL